MKKTGAKTIVSWLGIVVAAVALVFLAITLNNLRHDIDISILASPHVVGLFFLIALVDGMGVITASLNYRALVNDFSGISVSRPRAVLIYSFANLYKYIPGGIMYAAGRNRLAVEAEHLSHAKIVLSTVTEAVLTVAAVVMIISVKTFYYARAYVGQLNLPNVMWLVLALALCLLLLLAVFQRKRMAAFLKKMFDGIQAVKFTNILKRLAVAVFVMTLLGFTFSATLALMGQAMDVRLTVTASGLFLLAWLAGFLTPAPSGIGVREVVMLMFLRGVVDEAALLSALVVHRVLVILGDLIAHAIALVYARISKISKSPSITIE